MFRAHGLGLSGMECQVVEKRVRTGVTFILDKDLIVKKGDEENWYMNSGQYFTLSLKVVHKAEVGQIVVRSMFLEFFVIKYFI